VQSTQPPTLLPLTSSSSKTKYSHYKPLYKKTGASERLVLGLSEERLKEGKGMKEEIEIIKVGDWSCRGFRKQ